MKNKLRIASWSLYDLANQFFALNVVSLYFVRWLTLEKQAPEIFYSISFGASTLFIALSAPLLGAVSDQTGRRRPFLIYLTLISIIFTLLLGVSDSVFLALFFFAIANFGCQTAVVFYNAMLVNIAPKDKIGLVSGMGRMFGYSGAILALYLVKPVVLSHGYQATFIPTGLLFLIFALPCMFFVKDDAGRMIRMNAGMFFSRDKIAAIFKSLRQIAFDTQRYPGILNFLGASFFSLCSVHAIILFMSVYATRVFGLNESQILNLIAFSTLFAIAGSFLSGMLSDYFGHKRSLAVVFLLWILSFSLAAFVRQTYLYFFIGALVGVALGSTWTVSRALVIKLVPQEKVGEVFGLFNLVAYLSGIAGATSWGLIALIFSSSGVVAYRINILSLNLFMLVGFIFLLKIKEPSGKQ